MGPEEGAGMGDSLLHRKVGFTVVKRSSSFMQVPKWGGREGWFRSEVKVAPALTEELLNKAFAHFLEKYPVTLEPPLRFVTLEEWEELCGEEV